MRKCKNIKCEKEVNDKRVYCSLKCRNVYVNKYLRDYSKNAKGLSKKDEYEKNPKFCKNCNLKIPYEKKNNTYCGNSCSATVTNKGKVMPESAKIKIANALRQNNMVQCKNCGGEILKRARRLYCDKNCKSEYGRKHLDEYTKYKYDCQFKFSLNDYPEEFNFDLIEKYGWYEAKNRGDNLNGVSRDHKLSIRDGYDMGVDPYLMSHPANCQLMQHNDNVSKHRNSTLTINELKILVENWDKKYL